MPVKSCKNTLMNTTSPPPEEEGAGVEELRFEKPESGAGSSLEVEQYNALCLDLVSGKGMIEIGHKHNVSKDTVQRIKASIRDRIPDWKRRTSEEISELITDMISSLREDLAAGKLSPDKKSVTIGILADKKRDLDGDNVSVVRHEKADLQGNFAEIIADYLQSLPSANGEQLIDDQPQAAPNPLIINAPDDECPSNVRQGGGGDS